MLKTIRSQLLAIILLFGFFIFVSFLVSYFTVQDHNQDEAVIDLAHDLVLPVNQSTNEVLAGQDQAIIAGYVQDFEQAIQLIREGGQITSEEGTIIQIPAAGDNGRAALDDLSAVWQGFLDDIDQVQAAANDPLLRDDAEYRLLVDTVFVYEAIEHLVHTLEEDTSIEHSMLLLIQSLLFIAAIPIIFWAYSIIRNRIVSPLSSLTTTAGRYRKGHLDEPVKVTGEDEIGQLAVSFDEMRLQILANQENLKTRIDERTRELSTAFEFSQEIVSQLDLDQLLQSATEKIKNLMFAKAVSICLVTHDRTQLEMVAGTGRKPNGQPYLQPLENIIPLQVTVGGQTVVADVEPKGCAFMAANPEDHCLSTPLRAGNEIIGEICIIRERSLPLKQDEERALQLLANSVAIGIANVHLTEKNRRTAAESARLSERERMTSELHDNLAQTLGVLNMQTDELSSLLGTEQYAKSAQEAAQIKSNLNIALEQVRMVMSGEPAVAKSNGDDFWAEVEQILRNCAAQEHVSVELDGNPAVFNRLPVLAQRQIVYILREALTNVHRHAQAKKVSVQVLESEQEILFVIEDDGVGFDPEAPHGDHHLGLQIMQARAKRSGGNLTINSSPGNGTCIAVRFPQVAENTAAGAAA